MELFFGQINWQENESWNKNHCAVQVFRGVQGDEQFDESATDHGKEEQQQAVSKVIDEDPTFCQGSQSGQIKVRIILHNY